MKKYDVVILGGGCAGLSLAYHLEKYDHLTKKTAVIVEPRKHYKRDKTWSFWKTMPHFFEDCVRKEWSQFSINNRQNSTVFDCRLFPYQTIDSGLFYKKIRERLANNSNIEWRTSQEGVDLSESLVFDSRPYVKATGNEWWQHFKGIEIETDTPQFNDREVILMDFNCDQRKSVHFFYVLPFSPTQALIETTWFSTLDPQYQDYDHQLKEYISHALKIKSYTLLFHEQGAIPLFYTSPSDTTSKIAIGTRGGMTRISSGYTFLNIQRHSHYLASNFDQLTMDQAPYSIEGKYHWMDTLFLKVLKRNASKVPFIFPKVFSRSTDSAIKFISNQSHVWDDLNVILPLPKRLFIRSLFSKDQVA